MQGINNIFELLELQGVSTNQPLVYSFFFYDSKKENLITLADKLQTQGYRLIALQNVDKQFILHIDKLNLHNRESLFAVKQEFIDLTNKYNVVYDGFDIGNSDITKPLITDEAFSLHLENLEDEKLFQLAIKLYDFNIMTKAEKVLKVCIDKSINADVATFKLGNLLTNQDKLEEGLSFLLKATELNPNNVHAWFNLGAISYDNKQYQESLHYYQQANKIQPNDEDIIYGIVADQYVLKQFEQSLMSCQKVLQINPTHDNTKMLFAMLQQK